MRITSLALALAALVAPAAACTNILGVTDLPPPPDGGASSGSGSGGASGSGSGGASGSGSGGASGSGSGGASSSGANICASTRAGSACNACLQGHCTGQCLSCSSDPACAKAAVCVESCTSPACANQCLSGLTTTSQNNLVALLGDPSGCVAMGCEAACYQHQGVGDTCVVNANCVSGLCESNGVDKGWCTESCTGNPSCGTAPSTGFAGVCALSTRTNLPQCFPGCATNADCSRFSCGGATRPTCQPSGASLLCACN